jgi:hypothetical protein
VPSAVATIVEMNATRMLVLTTSASPGTPNGLSQALRLNWCHATLLLPGGSLNENRAITATGSMR